MKTNSRYKFKYKFFLRLRTVINKKILKFRKKKWVGLKRFLQKKRYRFYNNSLYLIAKNPKFFRNSYKLRLLSKQRLNSYYGRLTDKQLKYLCKTSIKINNIKPKSNRTEDVLLTLLEKRLETIIFRAHFAGSIQSARQLITHGNILVNGRKVFSGNTIVYQGDLIEVSTNINKIVNQNIKKSRVWPLTPPHLEINYKTLNIILIDEISAKNLYSFFPFWLNIKSVMFYYKK